MAISASWIVLLISAAIAAFLQRRLSFHLMTVAFLLYAVAWLVELIPSSLPQYAEFRDDGLFLRRGWKKTLIPYASLSFLRRTTSEPFIFFSLFTTAPIHIAAEGKKSFRIAVSDETEFLSEVLRRCPNLERWSFNLRRRLA
jgi:hypothetical protein